MFISHLPGLFAAGRDIQTQQLDEDNIMTISLSRSADDTQIIVKSPYDTSFISAARRIMGEWDAKQSAWVFDSCRKDDIKQALLDAYGWAPDSGDNIDIKITLKSQRYLSGEPAITLCGQLIGHYRKSGETVRWLKGGLETGGSRRNPTTETQGSDIFEMRNVPRAAVEHLKSDPNNYPGNTIETIEII